MTLAINAKTERGIVLGILGLALALRVIAAIVIPGPKPGAGRRGAHRDSATQLVKNWQMLNPAQMPLYPLLIAPHPGAAQLGAI